MPLERLVTTSPRYGHFPGASITVAANRAG